MAKEVENEKMENEELNEVLSRINKYYQKLVSDFEYHKKVYIDSINNNMNSTKYETNFNYSKKAVDNCKYYLYKYISTDNTETVNVNIYTLEDDDLPIKEEE